MNHLTLILAEEMIPVSIMAQVVIAIVVALVGGGSGVMIGKKIATRTEIQPNPLPVEVIENIVTKPEMEALERRIEARLQEIKSTLTEDRTTAKTTSDQTFHRINAISREIAETSGQLAQVNANIDRLYASLNAHPTTRRG